MFLSSTVAVRYHGEYEFQEPKSEDEVVNVVYINKERKRIAIRGKIGDNLMYLGHRHGIEIEGNLLMTIGMKYFCFVGV